MLFLPEQSKEPVDSGSGVTVDFPPSFSPVSRARKGFAWIASSQSNEGKAEIIKSEENVDQTGHDSTGNSGSMSTKPDGNGLVPACTSAMNSYSAAHVASR